LDGGRGDYARALQVERGAERRARLWARGATRPERERRLMAKNGGPAFPQGEQSRATNPEAMSLRDYFAAQALPAVISARVAAGDDILQESIAEECYELADAM